ncbi:hypothetical protein BDN72DRAFT_365827 [Pluteus cervinus]|uniref:Uncharacterized protein n=1 Tax=Pluteus cervinus TaxID=181527 RepID=A0ACD3BE01_9AGAR|nr:hypothetical protein BDN72DRAFT_365827 [Pluteus cervinus]
MATTLPSFVELMASLGLEQAAGKSETIPSSPRSSPPSSPRSLNQPAQSPTRARSNSSLRDTSISHYRVARYSPYTPTFPTSDRRGSASSISSVSSTSSEREGSPFSSYSSSPRLASKMPRRHKLSIRLYGSASELPANTPISTYVRRKTPGTSPTSPTFPHGSRDGTSPSNSPMPFSLPTLPPMFPRSPSSDSFPLTPDDVDQLPPSPEFSQRSILDPNFSRKSRRHIGVRISTPPSSAELHPQYRSAVNIA